MNKLIIAEKPSVALRLAISLSEGKPVRKREGRVSYFQLVNGNDTLFVVAAVGHLFTVAQKGDSKELPIFETQWVPSYQADRSAYFTKAYLDVIKKVGKECNYFINACDYDIEGSVIGSNIISYLINGDPNKEIKDGNVKRMHFSTTTSRDLAYAYANLEDYDKGNFEAGYTRHVLDWLWGINLSRALMLSVSKAGRRQTLSIGRVQGPALAILVNKELEIKQFVPKPYWEIKVSIKGKDFTNVKGKIFQEETSKEIIERTKSAAKGRVEKVETSTVHLRPLPPFDLTSLQVTASAVLGMDPSRALAIAQSLYERSYISYPRTSSQKLPKSLNLPRIISDLSKIEKFKALASSLLSANRFVPAEGEKEDEAHPAIFPTGEAPQKLSQEEERLYDLIAFRFLSVFAPYAEIERKRAIINIGGERYEANGSKVVKRGWLDYYPYYKLREEELPELREGEEVEIEKISSVKGMTKPPERFTKASLIALLEEKNLGTKATRAEIVDTLFKRKYVKGSKITVTDLGFVVYNTLSKYAPEIIDENLTRKLEQDMDKVMHGLARKEEVIEEGKQIIKQAIAKFKANEKEIGKELLNGVIEAEKPVVLGKCPKCGGDLLLIHSKNGKNYARCSNWPKCDASYPLPSNSTIIPTGKVCEICHTPIVKVFMRGKVFTMDLDPNCPTKRNWKKKAGK